MCVARTFTITNTARCPYTKVVYFPLLPSVAADYCAASSSPSPTKASKCKYSQVSNERLFEFEWLICLLPLWRCRRGLFGEGSLDSRRFVVAAKTEGVRALHVDRLQ